MFNRSENLLTPAEVAREFKISMRTLKTYREQGLPHLRLTSRTIRYRMEDVEEFQRQHYQTETSVL